MWNSRILFHLHEVHSDESYPVLYFVFILFTILFEIDVGSMQACEQKASTELTIETETQDETNKGTIWDLILPIIVLIILSVILMIYGRSSTWEMDLKDPNPFNRSLLIQTQEKL